VGERQKSAPGITSESVIFDLDDGTHGFYAGSAIR
jgi:hypothetical protein